MDNENIILSGSPIEISEYDTYKLATFLISVLDEYDLMGRLITKESGEAYHSTIRGFPIVAKLITDYNGNPIDFKGHELSIYRDKDGKLNAKFGTIAIGSVINSWIEEREVAGYAGTKSCIMIQAKLWSDRYPEYFKVLDKLWAANKVKSSWEIKTSEVETMPLGKRILKVFSFIGNALLGSNVEGAVPGAGVYEYSSLDNGDEILLAQALSNDICIGTIAQMEGGTNNLNEEKELEVTEISEDAPVEDTVVEEETAEEVPADDISEDNTETSVLTDYDLRQKLNIACRAKFDKWCWVTYVFPAETKCLCEYDGRATQLDYLQFDYTINGDDVEVGDPISTKLVVSIAEINEIIESRDNALIKANETIQSLTSELTVLKPFKEAAERAENERLEAENTTKRKTLAEYAQKSGFISISEITEDKTIKEMISELNESGIKNIIATRFMDQLNVASKEPEVEVAATKESSTEVATILDNDDDINTTSIIKIFLKK